MNQRQKMMTGIGWLCDRNVVGSGLVAFGRKRLTAYANPRCHLSVPSARVIDMSFNVFLLDTGSDRRHCSLIVRIVSARIIFCMFAHSWTEA